MSQAAFSLLTAGLKFKKLDQTEKDIFKKGKYLKTSSSGIQTKSNVPSSIDLFNYNSNEEEHSELKMKKSEKRDKSSSSNNDVNNINDENTKRLSSSFSNKDEINEFRNRMHISVAGGDIPPPISTFDAIPFRPEQTSLRKAVLNNIEGFEYKEPTPIQMQAIPIACANRDLLGIAPTGSGKTAAYLLPLIQRLDHHEKDHIRAIVLTPTLELTAQVYNHMTRLSATRGLKLVALSKATIGSIIDKDVAVDCVISTPLRLISTISSGKIDFAKVEVLVMDEGDKLFEDGFIEQIDTILGACSNPHLQRLLFSATLPPGVEDLARTVLRDPIRVVVGIRNSSNENVEQKLVYCGKEEGKLIAIRNIIREGFQPPMLIFVQSKERAKQLYSELAYDRVNVDVIHSDMPQQARNKAITRFRTGETWVLIATDLLGRGLDFLGLNTVLNYDFPQSGVEYIHRIGRTGRAGRKGKAITLFTEDDKPMLRSIANIMKISGCDVPEWMLQLKKIDKKDRRRIEKHAVKREDITTQAKFDRKKTRKNKKRKGGNKTKVANTAVPDDDVSLLS